MKTYLYYKGYGIEMADGVDNGMIWIRHPKTQSVVEYCSVDNYKQVIDRWFEVPESFENTHP